MGRVPAKTYRVKLAEEERQQLEAIRDRGSHKASKSKRAIALLLCDEGAHGPALGDAEVEVVTAMSRSTLVRLRQRCCETGPLGALERKARDKPPREIKITGEVEAGITRLACSKPPEGQARWTLRLLARRLVEIEVVESISHQSVALVLKKVRSSHGSSNAGASRRKKTPPS